MIPRATVRQLAEAVERQGGDMEDVRDLVACWERLHTGLHNANALYQRGDEQGAQDEWQELDAEFGKPLDEVVRHRRERGR